MCPLLTFSWDSFYQKEIQNFHNDPNDTGECWFEDSDAESKIIDFILEKLQEGADYSRGAACLDIVDLGTGNGHLLFELSRELHHEYGVNYSFSYTGIDYSLDSVAFARQVAARMDPPVAFKFEQVDLLHPTDPFIVQNADGFDILLDKGTLDAIALNTAELDAFDGKIGQDVYADQVARLMHSKLLLLITLCNFTESELARIITASGKLAVCDRIKYPTFRFGGADGSTICTLGFQRT